MPTPLLMALALAAQAAPAAQPEIVPVYLLAGQSNMEGYGFAVDLPPELAGVQDGVLVYHGKTVEDGAEGGGTGLWAPLQPGHGVGFDTDGSANALSNRFGPELSFARAVSEARGGGRVAIVKYVRGGTALVDGVSEAGSWDPDYREGNARNQYDNALTTIDRALGVRDVDGDGTADRLVPAGIVWMQGEADAAGGGAAAAAYEENLGRMMGLLRAALRDDDLPVVIGRIEDSGDETGEPLMAHAATVQAAQASFAEDDPCAALVDVTRGFGFLPDGWHYRSEDYVTLGTAFAEALAALPEDCGTEAGRDAG